MLSSERPVHCSPEVKDVGFWAEWFALNLLRRNIVRCALDSGLYGSDFTALTEVYDFDRAGLAYENIVGLYVAVDKAVLMHSVKAACDHPEYEQYVT